jgi:predicted nucleic acid-binding Zn ribbon protein
VHGVMARWEQIVGSDVAAHVTPLHHENGVLTVQAESSAWATQMRMLAGQIVKRLNEEIGDGSVTRLDVQGPQARSWRKGRLRVQGRGPRDTYG